MTETYQGWTNHATWVVDLWITNTPDPYKTLQWLLKQDDTNISKAKRLAKIVKEAVRTYQHEAMDTQGLRWGVGIRQDLREGETLRQVNWLEIINEESVN